MPVQKYDYEKLKKDFIASDYDDVKSFLSSKGIRGKIKNAYINGWSKDKQEYKKGILDKALARKQDELAKKLEVPAEMCLANIQKTIELSGVKLDQMDAKGQINTKDLNTIRAMNRIQNGMPTTYVKSENENMNTERIEAIHIVIGQKPIDSD